MSDKVADASLVGPFDVKHYTVTSTPPPFGCLNGVCCPVTLTLEAEEAVLKAVSPCATETKRMPYGQLGSVDKKTACGCCIGVDSNLTPAEGMISPGCGCDTALVEEIVRELKARMKERGDTGNIKRAEQAIDMMQDLNAKVDAILAHLNIPAPSTMDRP